MITAGELVVNKKYTNSMKKTQSATGKNNNNIKRSLLQHAQLQIHVYM